MKFRLLDLFSGIGGFSLGLERSGYFETVQFCEIEEFPRRVLAKHWPKVPCHDDIRTLDGSRLVPRIDAICGGFPCQDISVAGRGKGIEGLRSGLWRDYCRIIREIRPRWVVVENVSALLGRGLGRVLGDLASCGYDSVWDCIPASAFGGVHHRDRVWIVAYPASEGEGRETNTRIATFFNEGFKRISEGWQEGVYPDAWGKRIQGSVEKPVSEFRELSWGKDCGSVADIIRLAALHTPSLCRIDDGIPDRVDRIAGLGNAVVPQIPEMIGRLIGDYERALAA